MSAVATYRAGRRRNTRPLRVARGAAALAAVVLIAWLAQGSFLGSGPAGSGPFPDAIGPALPVGGLAGAVLVVDPGHGGRDPGTSAGDLLEKDIVLPVSLMVRHMLSAAGASVIMTRETDVDLSEDIPGQRKRTDLQARVALINDLLPDAVLSIHANWFRQPRWRGAQVFYNPQDPRNMLLAHAIQTELVAEYGVRRAIALDERQYILRQSAVPIVCVEIGFLSNPEDLRMLQNPADQERIAWAICRGVAAYLKSATLPVSSPER